MLQVDIDEDGGTLEDVPSSYEVFREMMLEASKEYVDENIDMDKVLRPQQGRVGTLGFVAVHCASPFYPTLDRILSSVVHVGSTLGGAKIFASTLQNRCIVSVHCRISAKPYDRLT